MALYAGKQSIDDYADQTEASADPERRQHPQPGPVYLTTKLENDESYGEHGYKAAEADTNVVIH